MRTKTFYIGKHGIQQENDCSVVALADYFEIDYKEAKQIANKNGLTDIGLSLENLLLAIWELSGRQPKVSKVNMTVQDAAKMIDSGFIIADGHVMQCSNFKLSNQKGYETKKTEIVIYV